MGAFRPHKLCRVVLALLLAHCPTAAFSEVTVRVDDAFTHVNLSPFLQYYADESGSLSFSDIRELPGHVWQTSGESIVTFGFTRSVYWFRFSSEGEVSDDVLLAHLEFVTDVAWTPDGTGYVTTFGSCNSTEMLEPAQLLRIVPRRGE